MHSLVDAFVTRAGVPKRHDLALFMASDCFVSTLIKYRHMSLVVRKPVFGVSDQVPHKSGCAVTEDRKRIEISVLGSRGIELSV